MCFVFYRRMGSFYRLGNFHLLKTDSVLWRVRSTALDGLLNFLVHSFAILYGILYARFSNFDLHDRYTNVRGVFQFLYVQAVTLCNLDDVHDFLISLYVFIQ
jgi:hypothetical protein